MNIYNLINTFTDANNENANTLFSGSSHARTVYTIPPGTGAGSIMVFPVRKTAAICLTDITLKDKLFLDITPTSQFPYSHISYFFEVNASSKYAPNAPSKTNVMQDTLYTDWGRHTPTYIVFNAGYRIHSLNVILSQDEYGKYLESHFNRNDNISKSLLSGLNHTRDIPELLTIEAQLRLFDGSGLAGAMFFESKLNEIIAISLKKSSSSPASKASPHKHSRDRTDIALIARYIRENISGDTDMDTLSHIACMSHSKLKRTFRTITGHTITEYRNMQRMSLARALLKDTDMTLDNIARQIGYKRTSSLNELFQKSINTTPGEYRKLHLPKT